MRRRRTSRAILGLAVACLGFTLAGCTAPDPEPTAAPTGRPVPTASAGPADAPTPTLMPDLSATENLPAFDYVNLAVVAANPSAGGRAFIDALVQAGFDKSKMEVTSDVTTLDKPADSIQFAVQFQGECLVGQFGPASGGYHGAVRPLLGTGRCLVGATVPIDW
ncbi:DUF6993 domain-containing protein [Agromyces larvae]|uniref:DUF6993 domain-containing protein n=1 Tax=Agromyces larvae TaxID=2929802 RepID=A0ABY4C1N0_9MICO|nr:hypothetical protein [Agromyces larvae]UOE45315.1 hypothetical protein MTO99_06000 [Agromyces larvae]